MEVEMISPQLVPPGGWKFKQGAHSLTATDYASLVRMVAAHRQSNGLPIGNPDRDVQLQIVEAHPHLRIGRKPLVTK